MKRMALTGRIAGGWLLIAAIVSLLGCSKSNAPSTIAVRGKVTYRDKAVPQGSVTFQPLKTTAGVPQRPATGLIQSDGTYQLSSFGKGDGAAPGEYRVLVIATEGGPSPEQPNQREQWLIPQKYGDAARTPLTATIPQDQRGPLEINFALKD